MGTILGILLSGYLADTMGWEAVFYVEGAMVVFFVGAWLLVVEESPSIHPRISAEERAYIEAGTAGTSLETKVRSSIRQDVRLIKVTNLDCLSIRNCLYRGDPSSPQFHAGPCS